MPLAPVRRTNQCGAISCDRKFGDNIDWNKCVALAFLDALVEVELPKQETREIHNTGTEVAVRRDTPSDHKNISNKSRFHLL